MSAPGFATAAFVGLGSNLDDPAAQVSRALDALGRLPDTECVARSMLYASRPMGPPDQPDYVNAVAMLTTTLSPHQLLTELQAIERQQGRVRNGKRWGSRVIDLDLLIYGEECCDDSRLQIPHPGIAERGFVLRPLLEIAPEVVVPGKGAAREMLLNLPPHADFVIG